MTAQQQRRHPDVCPCQSGCQSNADTWPSSGTASCVRRGDGGSTDDFLFLRKRARCARGPLHLRHTASTRLLYIYCSSAPPHHQPRLLTPTQQHSFTCRYLSEPTSRRPRRSHDNSKQVNMGGERPPRVCNNVQSFLSYVGQRFGSVRPQGAAFYSLI